jgi:hypothetical protein
VIVKISAAHPKHGVLLLRVPEAELSKVLAALKAEGFDVGEPGVMQSSQTDWEGISRTERSNPLAVIQDIVDGKSLPLNEPSS